MTLPLVRRSRAAVLAAAPFLMLACPPSLAAQQPAPAWPQWRGPDRDGISKETGWVVDGKAEPLWQKNVGMGYSTVSIEDGRLLTMGHDKKEEDDTIWCLDAATGVELWKHTFTARTMNMGHEGGTLSTPSFAGKLVFASNREGNFFCFETATGKLLWHKQLREEHRLKLPAWGLATSPLVLGNEVIMNVGPMLAFDFDGKLLWKSERSFGDAYSTPAEVAFDGKPALAVFDGDGFAVVGRKDGKQLQFHEWKTQYNVNAATPVVIGNKVFVSSGYNRGCAMFELAEPKPKLLWESKAMRNHMSGCSVFAGHLYGMDEGTLKCLDLDGNEKWAQKNIGKGAMSLADGKVLAMSSQGELVIAKASPAGYEELARRKVLRGGVYWTVPVLCGGLIYCRNSLGDLVCLDHRGTGQ
ncbi:MAG: alcohol dehydrogenase [Planctomycetes bacterium]|nr:alcohol dehydrogenase [Planctomycetota bacterium]